MWKSTESGVGKSSRNSATSIGHTRVRTAGAASPYVLTPIPIVSFTPSSDGASGGLLCSVGRPSSWTSSFMARSPLRDRRLIGQGCTEPRTRGRQLTGIPARATGLKPPPSVVPRDIKRRIHPEKIDRPTPTPTRGVSARSTPPKPGRQAAGRGCEVWRRRGLPAHRGLDDRPPPPVCSFSKFSSLMSAAPRSSPSRCLTKYSALSQNQ